LISLYNTNHGTIFLYITITNNGTGLLIHY
jgi:hypothetical protein